jgi:hypothetical protein
VSTGIGSPGFNCPYVNSYFGCFCCGVFTLAGSGVHHGAYGSSLPFSLDGGSPGGVTAYYDNSNPVSYPPGCCDIFVGMSPGGGGGGTLTLLADGQISVDGVIDVTGAFGGSAGSLLLRGGAGTSILSGGQLLAGPASANGGYVRLDAWGALPLVQGSILAPAPTLLELPHLRAAYPPHIGTTWSLDVFAPANTFVVLAASLLPGAGTPTPFGTLGIDLSNAATVATAVSPAGSHDPYATIPLPIPNNPNLVGLSLYMQGIALPTGLAARLTNTVLATMQ